jgi:hypothetical protein
VCSSSSSSSSSSAPPPPPPPPLPSSRCSRSLVVIKGGLWCQWYQELSSGLGLDGGGEGAGS